MVKNKFTHDTTLIRLYKSKPLNTMWRLCHIFWLVNDIWNETNVIWKTNNCGYKSHEDIETE